MALLWAMDAVAGPARPPLPWEQAFPTEHAPSGVHLEARFQGSDGQTHRLELWRHGTSFLRRRTDDVLDLYVGRRRPTEDYAYRLIDHRRHMVMDVHRNQLYRIGVFSDWFGLAHVIDRPRTAFTVQALSVPLRDRRPDCTWRLLIRESKGKGTSDETRVCWSSTWGVPLAIRAKNAEGAWIEQFTVAKVEAITAPAEDATLPAPPDGYASFDAGAEIDPQAGD